MTQGATGPPVLAAGPPPGPAQAWQPRPYTQLLRGPRHRWWRPLLSLLVVLAGLVAVLTVFVVGSLLVALASGHDLRSVLVGNGLLDESLLVEPPMVLLNNLALAALVPVSVLAVWAGHGWRPRWVSSVVGGLRWRWMLQCALLCTVLAVGSTVLLGILDGWPEGRGEHVLALLLVVALSTPLQSAGEEYLFRGWMSQTIGSVFARPVAGAVVASLVSATLFAMAHGGQNVWLWLDRFAFGLLASYLVWRTGGLEAAIAAHAVNNVVVFVPVVLTGTLADSLLVTDVPAGLVLVDVASMVVLGALLAWWARRRGTRRLHVPPPPGRWAAPLGRPAGFGPAHPLR